jgi:phytoene synthase
MNRDDRLLLKNIFKAGSKTYFNSSLFFPRKVRDDVYALYGFVRVADNFVDAIPQDRKGFLAFRKAVEQGRDPVHPVIPIYKELAKRKKFPPRWTTAFLDSMEMDLDRKTYPSLAHTLKYIYGSAEVIGLMMARIMDLPPPAEHHARYLGRAMQYINFIRDIDEDIGLGRNYFPQSDMKRFGLRNLSKGEALQKPGHFRAFIAQQLEKYKEWQHIAEQGYAFIPRRHLIAIKTAADMYNWTAEVIRKDPFVVFRKKVKPSRWRILWTVLKNTLRR